MKKLLNLSKMKFRLLLLLFICLCSSSGVFSQVLDSKGTDFWLTFPGNYQGTTTKTLFITSDVNTSGVVTVPGLSFTMPFSVTANSIITVVLPNGVSLETSNVIQNIGIHVTAVNEVTIYGLSRQQFTTDAFLALPTDILGTSYINLGYKNAFAGSGTEFGIVASQNATTVTITPTVTTDGHTAGIPYNINLNQGEAYQLRNGISAGNDLSGTIITSNKPIAVFGGHQCANIPPNASYCDHIVEQLPPTTAWGKNFVTVPLKSRLNGDTFRFLASENATEVRVNGTLVTTLNRGQLFETILPVASQIISSKPILVAQYSNGTTFDNVVSDPFMMLIPPYEQFLGGYTIATPATGFLKNYVNVVAPAAAVGSIRLDGVVIPNSAFVNIGTSGFRGAQMDLSLGAHTLTGGGSAFGVFVYGFDVDDSYGYPGGQSLSPVATVTNLTIDPKDGTGNTGVQTCFTSLVTDQFNNPVKDIRVDFTIKGVNPQQTGFAVTGADGIAKFCYAGLNGGRDSIYASVGTLTQGARFVWNKGDSCSLTTSVTTDNATGSVAITAAGGTPPYTFTLNGMSNNTGLFSGLSAGTYNYSVTDGGKCSVTGTVVISPVTNENCPVDFTIIADPNDCKGEILWRAPTISFPNSIAITPGQNGKGTLKLAGSLNGHGYYESDDQYTWAKAKQIASSYGGHLLTVNNAVENKFVYTNIPQIDTWGAWIGLYNTGTIGSFAWVTGEPLNFTNWIPGEPNNYDPNADRVLEQYVHIQGYDSLNRWNDLGDSSLKFIAEFDSSLITYRQINGPKNGERVDPGVYKICYETFNHVTGEIDTCCFNITIVCDKTLTRCPKDTIVIANPESCVAKVSWQTPTLRHPDSLVVHSANNGEVKLWYKGEFNLHGYYESEGKYKWMDAKSISASVGGHLVTINNSAENDFIFKNIKQVDTWGAWIGLTNTGTIGSFGWVTGEPLNYTNWIPGEPNNYDPMADRVLEPYVHIQGYDPQNRWNDLGDSTLKFIAEVEGAIFTYRQISGPENGAFLPVGNYTVCNERTNHVTGVKDTCCFNITVKCEGNTIVVDNSNSSGTISGSSNSMRATAFKAVSYPNPSKSGFSIAIQSDNTREKVSLEVVDLFGRVIEVKNGIAPNSTVQFGNSYKSGVYFTQIKQANKKISMKLIKL